MRQEIEDLFLSWLVEDLDESTVVEEGRDSSAERRPILLLAQGVGRAGLAIHRVEQIIVRPCCLVAALMLF